MKSTRRTTTPFQRPLPSFDRAPLPYGVIRRSGSIVSLAFHSKITILCRAPRMPHVETPATPKLGNCFGACPSVLSEGQSGFHSRRR